MSAKHTFALLHAGYEVPHRVFELCGMTATVLTGAWLSVRLATEISVWWIPIALVLGTLGADLVSGVVHWACDTWGGEGTPVLGRLFIRAFRAHHFDPRAFLTHDFIETNGHNFTLALSLTSTGLWLVTRHGVTPRALFTALCLLAMAVFVSLTSQIHKWAHMDRPPRTVRWLQRARLVLSHEHHARHHDAPYVQNYCITAGWLDGLLRATRVFERVERLVAVTTGIEPRRHA